MPFIELNNIETQVGDTNSWEWLYSLIGVVLGFSLTLLYQYCLKKKSIKETGELYKFYIKSLEEDIQLQIDDIERYLGEVDKYKESESVIDGLFIFDFIDKINTPLLIGYFKSEKIENKVEKANELFDNLSFAKNEMKKVTSLIADYEVSYFEFENKFYDYLIQFQKDMKLYEDSSNDGISKEDKENLDSLNKIIDGHLENSEYDLFDYISYDQSLMKELLKHPYYIDSKHNLYIKLVDFIDNWHKLTMRVVVKRDLHLARIESVKEKLKTVKDLLFENDSKQ